MDLKPIGLPVSRHEGRLQGKWTLRQKSFRANDRALFTQAHFTVFDHSVIVDKYVQMHKTMLSRKNLFRSEVWIAREHRDNFGDWLLIHLMHARTEDPELRALTGDRPARF